MNHMRWLGLVWIGLMLVSCAPRASAEPVPLGSDSLDGTRSGTQAFLYSFLGTAIPLALGAGSASSDQGATSAALIVAGCIAGPSLGHFYAGRPSRAMKGIGIRTAGAIGLIGMYGLAMSMDTPRNGDVDALALVGVAGFGIGAVDMVVDIVRAPHSARVHNEELRQARLKLTPARVGEAPGIRVDATF